MYFSGTTAQFLAGQATLRRERRSATSQVVSCLKKYFLHSNALYALFLFACEKHLTDYISVPLLNNNTWGKFNSSVGICAGKRRVYLFQHGPAQTPIDNTKWRRCGKGLHTKLRFCAKGKLSQKFTNEE